MIPIFMALTPVPFAVGYIWRTGKHPEPGVDTGRTRAFATGVVVGSLVALVIAGLVLEDGFGFFAAFVAVGIVTWLAVALDQGDSVARAHQLGFARKMQRGVVFLAGLLMGCIVGVVPWLALIVVLQNA